MGFLRIPVSVCVTITASADTTYDRWLSGSSIFEASSLLSFIFTHRDHFLVLAMFKAMGLEDADTGMDQSLIPSAEKSFDDTESWGGSSIKPLDRTKRWHRIHVTVLYLIVVALLGTIAYLGYGPSTPAGQKLLVLCMSTLIVGTLLTCC